MEEEQLSSFTEYDEKCSIHYRCEEWMAELCRLLQESNDIDRYEGVKQFMQQCDERKAQGVLGGRFPY